MQRRPGIAARYFGDLFAAKLPAAKATAHPGAGSTYFHQDFINWALDRSGGMTFWIALADLPPESGTMSFLSGSHRLGALGHYRTYAEDEDIFDDFPELRAQCRLSEPMRYAAGDATVHSVMTVHGAGENRTDDPRWAYIVMANPSDARWNGAPPEAYATEGMVLHQQLDDARFPVIG
jgi:ectoine hydroxylase-related dioxygenase (phytanoyl-CoA dioxygenase family)